MRDIALENHRAWLGLLQPVGLVVSPYALVQAQASIDQNLGDLPLRFGALLQETEQGIHELPRENIQNLFTDLLGWRTDDLLPAANHESIASIYLPDYQETVKADYVVKLRAADADPSVLVQIVSSDIDFDSIETEGQGWQASYQAKFERLLRDKNIPIGLLVGTRSLRLVYAPKGESSGHVTFPYNLMKSVTGRPVLAAFKMLLGSERLFSLPDKERLPALLLESRQYQNVVSTKLAEQVLAALYEFLRGLQAADERRQGTLLRSTIQAQPNEIYHASITTLMRLVFILFAEDRDLIPSSEVYAKSYSVKGLFERLRQDDARHQDTMDQRYGAWAQLLVLFRLLYHGVESSHFTLPARHGHLFDPSRFPFLEGRQNAQNPIDPPLIADGVVFRILSNLMILDGERISYRALDVEQIGSVYETVMGFQVEVAAGVSLAIKPKKTHGAPTHINLEEVLAKPRPERKKHFKAITDQEVTGDAIESASTIEELEAALDRKAARIATPQAVAKGALILQPSDARRKSGSHYTPRSLTEPIVQKALEPVLAALGQHPTPEQILDLKICDPAMGSGAFLVEATRQLSEHLVKSWSYHKTKPDLPPDEDELLHARRLVVQRCIYGVDKNPMAVNLAKLSLWLVTFARDHSFTFLDHAIKAGDSLVGLNLRQISSLTWEPLPKTDTNHLSIQAMVDEYLDVRDQIRTSKVSKSYDDLSSLNDQVETTVTNVRFVADAIITAWFSGTTDRQRSAKLEEVEVIAANLLAVNTSIRTARLLPTDISTFHWQLEYPEVFLKDNGGFDVIVGNPPFLGGRKIRGAMGVTYLNWLNTVYEQSRGNADLVSYFFRKAFSLIRSGGTMGLIATNTIRQGDTRYTGLRWICQHGGLIFHATRRLKWPGEASVIVSLVHLIKNRIITPRVLDGKIVENITAFLFHRGGNEDPHQIKGNADKSFQGSIILGSGFLFDDTSSTNNSSSIAKMNDLIEKNPHNADRIFPYIGGDEINSSPTHSHHRFVINFWDLSENDASSRFPDLMQIVREKVKPERTRLTRTGEYQLRSPLPQKWWQYADKRPALYAAIGGLERVLVISRVTASRAFTFLPSRMVFNEKVVVFATDSYPIFALLTSRIHSIWCDLFNADRGDTMQYAPTDCFETFPFPTGEFENEQFTNLGRSYYELRSQIMVNSDEGLTKVYNRFNDPEETSDVIIDLRARHAAIDKAVLDAYGWSDIAPNCEFLLDYEDDDEESDTGSRRRRKPWRYRWPDEIRDEVLARLLDLNAKRAEEERLAGASAGDDSTQKKSKKTKVKPKKAQ
jgi:hypothetical protein